MYLGKKPRWVPLMSIDSNILGAKGSYVLPNEVQKHFKCTRMICQKISVLLKFLP